MTSTETHVVGISGSRREGSYTRVALDHALTAASTAGASMELLDLKEFALPAFDPDRDRGSSGDADALATAVRTADAVVLASPVYHGSYSSPLKTALDYCGFEEFEDKTVGLLAVAGGAFPVVALDHMRAVCRALNAWVLPHEVAIPRSSSAFEDGTFVDDDLENRVGTLGRRVVQYADIEPDPDSFESGHNVGARGK